MAAIGWPYVLLIAIGVFAASVAARRLISTKLAKVEKATWPRA